MSEAAPDFRPLVTPSVRAWLSNFLRFERDRIEWGNTMEGKLNKGDYALLKGAHMERIAFLEFVLKEER